MELTGQCPKCEHYTEVVKVPGGVTTLYCPGCDYFFFCDYFLET